MIKKINLLLIIVVIFGLSANGFSKKLSERKKISALLDAVEKSKLTFVRNGHEHSSYDARCHLEMKLDHARHRIKTAEQFITHLASKSSWSGKPYYIKLRDGKKIKSADWFRARLKEIENVKK